MNATKKTAVEVTDKGMTDLCTRRVRYYRETLNDGTGYKPGLGRYALYGIIHSRGLIEVIGDASTTTDFNRICTAKAKAETCSTYDHVIEWRNSGTSKNPKLTVTVWSAE